MACFSAVPRSIATALAILGAFAACGGESADPTDPDSKAGVSFSLSPKTLTLIQGQSGTVSVSVSRTGGFKGALSLSTSGLPPGVTGTFNPASIPDGGITTTLTIATVATAALGTLPVFIEASLNGAQVNINGTPAELTLTVNLRPTVTVSKSGSGSGTVTSNPAGINCGSVCSTLFTKDPVTLTAVPAAGSAFVSWAGSCVGTSTTCTFTPGNFVSNVTATFNSTSQAIAVADMRSPMTGQARSSEKGRAHER